MTEVLMFPIRNERGFTVEDEDDYHLVMQTIMNASLELQEEFPENPILVVFEV